MSSKRAPVGSEGRKDRLAGKTIADRYVIESLIARGGMAAVYRAQQVQLNRRIAIKILRPPPDSDENASFHERFRLEAETLAQLNHPNIVTVYDHGDFDDDQVFLAMEFVDGRRLTDLLRDGPLSVDRSLHLLLQVCEALRYAHRRGVVHRDLKPSNLLITETDDGDELVKVVDFGLVKLTEVDVTITSNGLILGSPHCMAPEQVRGQKVDPRTDIYAMGVLLFRCLTGTYPFHGNNSTATMIAHLNQATPTFFSVSPDLEVPDGLENVVRRCLAKSPGERFQSMEEVQEALAYFLNVTPDQYRTVSRSQVTLERYVSEVRGGSSTRWLVIGGVAVVALLLVLVAGVAAGTLLVSQGSEGRPIPLRDTTTADGGEPVGDGVDAGVIGDTDGAGDSAVEEGDTPEEDAGVEAGSGAVDDGGGTTGDDRGTAAASSGKDARDAGGSGGRAASGGSTAPSSGSTAGSSGGSGSGGSGGSTPSTGSNAGGSIAPADGGSIAPADGGGEAPSDGGGETPSDGGGEDTDGWMEWDDME